LCERYQAWLKERDAEKTFTPEQREWLDRMAEHIATSLSIELQDFSEARSPHLSVTSLWSI